MNNDNNEMTAVQRTRAQLRPKQGRELTPELKNLRDEYLRYAQEEGIDAGFDVALGKLLEIMLDVETPPLAEVPLLEHEDDGSVLILDNNGRRVKVPVYQEFKGEIDDASVGDNLWLHPKAMLAVGATGRRATGKIGTIQKVRDGKMLVSADGLGQWWQPVNGFEAKPGYSVSVLDDKTVVDAWEEPSHTQLIERPDIGYDSVGGLDHVIETIQKKVEMPLKFADGFEALNIRRGGGVLMHGPPGTGKTLLARATAGEANASFFNVKISDILSKWLGESEARITSIFQKARDNAPAVIFIDEFEALGQTRTGGQNGGTRAYGAIVSQFLTELDGVDDRGDIVIMAATNRIDLVDKAFLRPGRFDEAIEVPPPGREAAEKIAAIHLPTDLPYEDDVEPEEMQQRIVEVVFDHAEEPTGALIEGLANEIKVACVQRCGNNPKLSFEDVDAALANILNEEE